MGPASKMFVISNHCLGQSISLHTGLTPSQPRSTFHKGCQSWSRSSFTLAVIKSTLFHPDRQAYVTWALQTPGTVPLRCAADLMFHTPVLSSQFPEQSSGHPSVLPQLCSWLAPLTLQALLRGSLGAAPFPKPTRSLYHPLLPSVILCCWTLGVSSTKSMASTGSPQCPPPDG